ncbi:MAG: DUF6159 family protein, partial [Chloroflexota bacterium]
RIQNSWELTKASWSVLKQDKELAIFPVISGVGVILVSLTFILPMVAAGLFDSMLGEEVSILTNAIGLLYYVITYTVIFFANTALMGAAMIRLRGGDPTVRDGLNIAMENFGSILGYAFIAATVGMILRWLSERAGFIGRLVIGLIGMAWTLATYLVVPVLVVEKVGPVDAIKRSAELLKKTWGEQIAGNLGIGMVFGLLMVGVVLLTGLLAAASAGLESFALMAIIIAFGAITFITLAIISSTLTSIYTAAVYLYATEGQAGDWFDDALIAQAFKQKEKRGLMGR